MWGLTGDHQNKEQLSLAIRYPGGSEYRGVQAQLQEKTFVVWSVT